MRCVLVIFFSAWEWDTGVHPGRQSSYPKEVLICVKIKLKFCFLILNYSTDIEI